MQVPGLELIDTAEGAVTLALGLIGVMAFFLGSMKVAEGPAARHRATAAPTDGAAVTREVPTVRSTEFPLHGPAAIGLRGKPVLSARRSRSHHVMRW